MSISQLIFKPSLVFGIIDVVRKYLFNIISNLAMLKIYSTSTDLYFFDIFVLYGLQKIDIILFCLHKIGMFLFLLICCHL